MIKNCICGLRRDLKDPTFKVITDFKVTDEKQAQFSTIDMFACRGCGVTYVKIEPANKVVLAG